MSVTPASLAQIELSIPIGAPVDRVWAALVNDITPWWSRNFFAGNDVKAMLIEPKLGGRMYEEWGDGGGLTWYTVMSILPGRYIELAGYAFPSFGGPVTSLLRLELEAEETGTTLKLTDGLMGRLTKDKVDSISDGWNQLFANGFRRYVEQGIRA